MGHMRITRPLVAAALIAAVLSGCSSEQEQRAVTPSEQAAWQAEFEAAADQQLTEDEWDEISDTMRDEYCTMDETDFVEHIVETAWGGTPESRAALRVGIEHACPERLPLLE